MTPQKEIDRVINNLLQFYIGKDILVTQRIGADLMSKSEGFLEQIAYSGIVLREGGFRIHFLSIVIGGHLKPLSNSSVETIIFEGIPLFLKYKTFIEYYERGKYQEVDITAD